MDIKNLTIQQTPFEPIDTTVYFGGRKEKKLLTSISLFTISFPE